jgi:hypothetical protein
VNRLGSAGSAYLAAAARQPVHWYPWGEEAFAAARAADRPILLDIGAAWCHWCHVMDRESYEDPDLAAFLNAHFVSVKVDRDERPDVDARYQRAVQALSGQGGWPLTAFLTPEGDVFYGGTYFPPEDRHGRVGLRTVLERVASTWREQRESVRVSSAQIREHVAGSLREARAGALDRDALARGADRMARLFDWRYGGFGTAPKFPHPGAVEFLLARWWDTGQPWLREIAEKTLDGMARGGIHDQVGGGFHRYAVDERWCVPHFEKMAADNAELLRVYLHACAAWQKPLHREVADGICGWALEVLADRAHGGFAASQDADVGLDDDGNHFTWTPDEAAAVLDAAEWDVARRRWDIYPRGEMPHDPARNVLWVGRSIEAIAQETGRDGGEARDLLERARAKLKAARDRRPAPFVDRTIYTGWNAMLAEALLEAGAVLGRVECTEQAVRTLERLWEEGFVAGKGMVHRLSAGTEARGHGDSEGPWLLEDQAHAASAFLAAFEHTGEGKWLDRGRELTDMMLAFYWDAEAGGFFDAREQAGGLLAVRAKPVQDAPNASPNGTSALVLLRLAVLAGEPRFRERAEQLLTAFASEAADLGVHGATYLRALDFLLNGESKIVVADATTSIVTRGQLLATALSTYRPRRVVVPTRRSPVPGVEPPVALVCAGVGCAAPVREGAGLRHTLETFGRGS